MSDSRADANTEDHISTASRGGQRRHGRNDRGDTETKPMKGEPVSPASDLDQALEVVRKIAAAPVVREPAPLTATAADLVKEAAGAADDFKAYALLNAALRKLSMEQRRALPVMIRREARFANNKRFVDLAASFQRANEYSDQRLTEMPQPTQIAL